MTFFRVETLVDVAEAVEGTVDEDLLRRAVQAAFEVGASDGGPAARSPVPNELTAHGSQLQVSLRVTSDEELQRLNRSFRGVDGPTDVLSFSFLEGGPEVAPSADVPLQLGEIVLSFPCAARQARDLGHSIEKELAWLTIHGALQLLGYAHDTDERADRMEGLEQQALRAIL